MGMDSDSGESRSESLITHHGGEGSDEESSTAVRNPVNSRDKLSVSQGENSRPFEASGDTPTNSQSYQDNPVMFGRKTFECKRCSYSSPIRFGLKRHMLTHSGDQCGKLEKTKQRGEINESSKQLHRCEYCSYSTNVNKYLKMHIRAHTVSNRRIYSCSECDYKSIRQALTHHVMKTHKIKSKDASLTATAEAQQLRRCDFCSFSTYTNKGLKIHRKLHTVRNRPIVSCTKCDYKAPRITIFYHYKSVHGSRIPVQSTEKKYTCYTCKFCSYSTHNKFNLNRHTRLHTVHNRPVYHCPKCDYKSTEYNFLKHVKIGHKIQSIDTKSFKKTHKQTVALSKKNTLGATTGDVQKCPKQSDNNTNENEGEQTLERSETLLVSKTKNVPERKSPHRASPLSPAYSPQHLNNNYCDSEEEELSDSKTDTVSRDTSELLQMAHGTNNIFYVCEILSIPTS